MLNFAEKNKIIVDKLQLSDLKKYQESNELFMQSARTMMVTDRITSDTEQLSLKQIQDKLMVSHRELVKRHYSSSFNLHKHQQTSGG